MIVNITTRNAYPQTHHTLEITNVDPNTQNAIRIADILSQEHYQIPETICAICGTVLVLPDGNLTNHIQKLISRLGTQDSYIKVAFRHKGPRPAQRPAGIQVAPTGSAQKTARPNC